MTYLRDTSRTRFRGFKAIQGLFVVLLCGPRAKGPTQYIYIYIYSTRAQLMGEWLHPHEIIACNCLSMYFVDVLTEQSLTLQHKWGITWNKSHRVQYWLMSAIVKGFLVDKCIDKAVLLLWSYPLQNWKKYIRSKLMSPSAGGNARYKCLRTCHILITNSFLRGPTHIVCYKILHSARNRLNEYICGEIDSL